MTPLLIGTLTFAFNIQTVRTASTLETSISVGTTDSVGLTLDPAQTYDYFGWCILQQIAGTLVSIKPGSTSGSDFVPDLALSWNSSADSKTWDFQLRQDVKFPDGTTFNAAHVKDSFDRAIALIPSIPEGAPAGLYYDLIFGQIEVLSTYKVRFHLNFPFSPLLGILACRTSAIVDPMYAPLAQVNYTAGNPRASTPVAFVGPYVLSKWERVAGRDVEIILDANPNYWNLSSGYPKLKQIVFKFYPNAASLRLAIEAGDVDMAFRHISPTDVLDLQNNPNLRVWWGDGTFIQYLCFQQKRAPFNDARVRVAVAAALNRTEVTNRVFLGLANPLYSIIPLGLLGHTEAFKALEDANANYALTKSLLAEAGYDETNKLTFDLWYESSGHYPSSAEQALLYKEALEASGVVSVTLKSADWAIYRMNRDNEIMDAYVYGWYPDYVDPDDYSFLYWAGWLHTNYSNETQVALFSQARATTNTTLRAELYAQIDDIAVDQCSVVPLYVSRVWAVTKPNVSGIYLDLTQDMRYWLIYYETPIDIIPPVTAVSLGGVQGDSGWFTSDVTVTLSATDDTSGVDKIERSLDNATWTTYTASFTVSAEGITTVYCRSTDKAGNSERIKTETIKIDKTVPSGSIMINNDAAYADSSSVTLTLTATDVTSGVYQVRYSNDGVWDAEPWESPSPAKTWTLAHGDGTKTVFYQIKDYAGLVSETYSDNINLDTAPPTGSITINNGASYVSSSSVTLALSSEDATSGVAWMRLSNDNATWTPWEAYSTSRAWTLKAGDGMKTVYVQYVDAAGWMSQSYSSAITLDTGLPAITITSPILGQEIKSSVVPVTWTCSDETSGMSHCEIMIDEGSWINVGTNTIHEFTGLSDGTHVVEVKAYDQAGLTSVDSVEFVVNTSPLFGPGYFEEEAIAAIIIVALIAVAIYFIKFRK